MPRCSMGLNRRVSGKGTLTGEREREERERKKERKKEGKKHRFEGKAFGKKDNRHSKTLRLYSACDMIVSDAIVLVRNPEKAQLMTPPITTMGIMFSMDPFIMSIIMLGSTEQPRHMGEKNHLIDDKNEE